MVRAILIHGLGGNPDENWFPWLKEELEALGANVIAPHFPNSNRPKLDEWLNEFRQYNKLLGTDTILVGHSLGCAFILRVLELVNRQVKAAFFIAPFDKLLKTQEVNSLIRNFVDANFNWGHIRHNAGRFYVFHSDNDPYIPLDTAMQFALNLGVELSLVKGAGHFNKRFGYMKFPRLLEAIKKEI